MPAGRSPRPTAPAPHGEPRDTGIRIENMAALIRVERSMDAHQRAAAIMRDLVERGVVMEPHEWASTRSRAEGAKGTERGRRLKHLDTVAYDVT